MTHPYEAALRAAVKHFWTTREQQAGVLAAGHMDRFIDILRQVFLSHGFPAESIRHRKGGVNLPGYYRPTKQWDLVVVHAGTLVAAVEFKSQKGSIGNNANNRAEEAIGSGIDLQRANQMGLMGDGPPPFIGYFMVLGDEEKMHAPVKASAPPFGVDPDFGGASYLRRYEILLSRLVRDRHYDGACIVLTPPEDGKAQGAYHEPCTELTFATFLSALHARLEAFPLRRPGN